MIKFNYETNFRLSKETDVANWLSKVIASENFKEDEINYIFCNDDYLYKLNVEFLNHETLTDIISFDYSVGKIIQGDIFISVERVIENANDFGVEFESELNRVMVHGVLHYCGYKDKTEKDTMVMRNKENHYLKQLV